MIGLEPLDQPELALRKLMRLVANRVSTLDRMDLTVGFGVVTVRAPIGRDTLTLRVYAVLQPSIGDPVRKDYLAEFEPSQLLGASGPDLLATAIHIAERFDALLAEAQTQNWQASKIILTDAKGGG